MILKAKFIATTFIMLATSVFAQQQNPLTGTWQGSAISPSTGNEILIEMKIKDNAGSWRFNSVGSAKRASPCFGHDFPLAVQNSEESKFVIQVESEKTIKGCPSFKLAVQTKENNILEGKFSDGRTAKFTKQ